MLIVIQFTDNNFGYAYEGIGKIILEALRQDKILRHERRGKPIRDMSKEDIASLVNSLLDPMYTLFQCRKDDDFTDYLPVSIKDIYLEKEAQNFVYTTFTDGRVLVINTDCDYPDNQPVQVI